MIAGLSKAITLYLAPLLLLTSVILSLFAYLAPTLLLHDRVALLTVTPSRYLISIDQSPVDGPSIFLGALGSCARTNNAGTVFCTAPTVSPKFDLSALPSDAPSLLLSAPTATTPVFIAIALACTTFFFIAFTLTSFRHKMGKFGNALDKPMLHRVTAWIGFFGFFIGACLMVLELNMSLTQNLGFTAFLILRMWFGKAVDDFNTSIISRAPQAPALIASTGNGFIMVYVAYAFHAVPLIVSLAKLNVSPASK
ncbi:hypothetical protein HGRIS_007872 [Hohenbuehelia grisea]|uniref:Uncharacterized protein n=1 Tax=Hohenbuehelia grisea TaxID=104357 RepID=A0ABR3J662_9AGAR